MNTLFLITMLTVPSVSDFYPDVYAQPAISEDFDAAVIFLRDGLEPCTPWGGFSDSQREKFWTLGFKGLFMQKCAWAGYLIAAPAGSTDLLLDFSCSLSEPEQIPDMSVLGSALQMVPSSRCGPVVILFSDSFDSFTSPDSLPLRKSMWLSAGSDTLIAPGSWNNSAFLWTVASDTEEAGPMPWRGTECEVIPALGGSVTVLVTAAPGGTPSNIGSLTFQPHPGDSVFTRSWLAILNETDRVLRDLLPPVSSGNNLIWFRGMGSDEPLIPWTALPSPQPPARPSYRVNMPADVSSPGLQLEGDLSCVPGIARADFPGKASCMEAGLIASGILERYLARDLPSIMDTETSFAITAAEDGTVTLWFSEQQVPIPKTEIITAVIENIAPLALSLHSEILVHNATVRASVQAGKELSVPSPYQLNREIGSILGLL